MWKSWWYINTLHHSTWFYVHICMWLAILWFMVWTCLKHSMIFRTVRTSKCQQQFDNLDVSWRFNLFCRIIKAPRLCSKSKFRWFVPAWTANKIYLYIIIFDIRTNMFTYIYIEIIHIYIYVIHMVHTYSHIHTYIYIYIYMHTCMHPYIHTYLPTYIHTYIDT